MRTELKPVYDSRKSFYGKAVIEMYTPGLDDSLRTDIVSLYSYGTLVAAITIDEKAVVYGLYSATTLRHIKEFLRQNGFKAESKAQIVADYMGKN